MDWANLKVLKIIYSVKTKTQLLNYLTTEELEPLL